MDFARALPVGHCALLVKIGAAWSPMLAGVALAGVPAYLIALAYGGVDALDVGTYFLLLLAVVSGPSS